MGLNGYLVLSFVMGGLVTKIVIGVLFFLITIVIVYAQWISKLRPGDKVVITEGEHRGRIAVVHSEHGCSDTGHIQILPVWQDNPLPMQLHMLDLKKVLRYGVPQKWDYRHDKLESEKDVTETKEQSGTEQDAPADA